MMYAVSMKNEDGGLCAEVRTITNRFVLSIVLFDAIIIR